MLLTLVVISENANLSMDFNQVYACTTYQLGFPSPTEIRLNWDKYGPISPRDTSEFLGLSSRVSLGRPTPAPTPTPSSAPSGEARRIPSRTGGQQRFTGRFGAAAAAGGPWEAPTCRTGQASPIRPPHLSLRPFLIVPISGCSKDQILPQSQPEPLRSCRAQLPTTYTPIRNSLPFPGGNLARGSLLAQHLCLGNPPTP